MLLSRHARNTLKACSSAVPQRATAQKRFITNAATSISRQKLMDVTPHDQLAGGYKVLVIINLYLSRLLGYINE
jgi:hypothetical protein